MREYEFDPEALSRGDALFPSSVADDEWVLYHGTSDQFAAKIESEGLRTDAALVSRQQFAEVAEAFLAVGWERYRFRRYEEWLDRYYGHIFLSPASNQAHSRATREHAGGSAVSTLRWVFSDLRTSVDDPLKRSYYRRWQDEQAAQGCAPYVPDVSWATTQLDHFADLVQLCDEVRNRHRTTVVYAVRISPDQLSQLKVPQSLYDGIICTSRIGPEQLVGKVHIPADRGHCESVGQLLSVWNRTSGVLHELDWYRRRGPVNPA